ncbi:RING finger protein PFF0165c-like isoform X1 [Diorhabda sublineata]|uniref:RING finger protein PFF0165c-like isoform X1 n=1 Tax=Diorhabda sublineata TaxID=1163346 RepID=UPI0024E177BD|nr:RING finger protein PFF0165c-like isoform X1 [Diorhabda sublineata]
MDKKQFDIFFKELLKLKEKLKCPICFDLMEEHAELECGHRFCLSCFTKHKSISIKETLCPLCKAPVKRRSIIYKDLFADKMSGFVFDVCKEIESKETLNQINVSSNSDDKCVEKLDSKNEILNQPSTSKKNYSKCGKTSKMDKDEGKSRGAEKQERNNLPKTSTISQKSISKDEAFDKLLKHTQELRVNKKGKQYKNTKRVSNKKELEYKILDFHDDANKDAVLHWLSDTRNQFSRLTQTQYVYGGQKSEVNSLELPSVSQIGWTKGKKSHFPRAKSLDIQIKRKREKRRSAGSFTGLENNQIGKINKEDDIVNKAKEKVLLQIMEDEYLNEMEGELEHLKKMPNNQDTSTGWERIEKLAKSLKNENKGPKKLNVTVQHIKNTNNNKKVENVSKVDEGGNEEQLQVPTISESNVCYKKDQVSTIFYDLNEFEHYAEQNMEPILKELNASSTSQSIDEEKHSSLSNIDKECGKNIVVLENVVINNADQDPYLLPTQKINNLDNSTENKEQISCTNDIVLVNELESFEEVMNILINDLKLYSDNKRLTKRHIKSIENYLVKLNNLHIESHSKQVAKHVDRDTQTEKTVVDIEVQTEVIDTVNSEVQTEDNKYDDMEIETLQDNYDKNSDRNHSIDNFEGITRTNSKISDLPKVIQNHDFGATLELMNFETQEFEKQYQQNIIAAVPEEKNLNMQQQERVKSPSTMNFDNIDQKENPQYKTKDLLESNITNKRSQNPKRRLSDSDSSDVLAVPKKRCNRFIRDDLSVEFDSLENPHKQTKTRTDVFIDSDDDNNEDYLDKVLKKYENLTSPLPQYRKENSNLGIVTRSNENINSSKSEHEENLSRLENDLKETESSDIIDETENIGPSIKKTKLPNEGNEGNDSPVKPTKSTYCQELEDSFDEMNFANIPIENLKKKESEEDLFSDDDYVETTPPQQQQRENCGKRSLTAVANLMTRYTALDDVDKEIIENFDTNFAPLSPPPGFEDDKNTTAPEEVTVIDLNDTKIDREKESNKLSANEIFKDKTEPRISKMVTSTPGKYVPLHVDRRKMLHSTPISQNTFSTDTLGFSPILEEKSAYEKALKSNTLISNISQESPRNRNLLTSSPKQKSILNYIKQSQTCNSNLLERKPCIACTRLSKDQVQSISLLTNKKLATYSPKFTNSVTHMIVTADDRMRIKDYTMKFVSAVASGIWVLGFEWIQECLRTNSIVPEEPYEVLDDAGHTGPKMARLTRLEQPLFKNYIFYCVSPLYSTTVEDVEELINRLGGVVVKNLENLKKNVGGINLIITEGRSTQDFEIYERWLEKYEVVTVDIEWLSRSVGRYKILSVRPYLWCSDDNIEKLGYPIDLIENTCSLSEPF